MTAINPYASTGAPASGSALGQLGGDAFLQLLVAQLRYQNPLEPSDPSAMLGQTAQFTQVETLQELARMQQMLAGLQQAGMAADLVGKQVTAPGPDGLPVTGTVDAVRFTEQGPVLLVGDLQVPLSSATELRAAATAPPTA